MALQWLGNLINAFGVPYLFAVVCFNHVMKGFVLMYTYIAFDFVMRMYCVRGPQLQVLKSVAMLPWVLKPLLGLLSDAKSI
eukprot:6444283-Amphidinium_carterae.1